MNINDCGIYQIKNLIDQKIYIGGSNGIAKRWKNHIRLLNANTHTSIYLQNAWNKYGENAFEFRILEYCLKDKELLTIREQYWIDNSSCLIPNGYNILPRARSRLGTKHSPETIMKMSASIKGVKHSLERRLNQSKGQLGRAAPNRKLLMWPHERGRRCLCKECMKLKAQLSKEYRIINEYKRPSLRR